MRCNIKRENLIAKEVIKIRSKYDEDFEAMILWTYHKETGAGKKRLERFYETFCKEYDYLKEKYEEEDGTYPARAELEKIGIDLKELGQRYG